MKYSALSIGLFAGALGAPPSEVFMRDDVQTAHLTFHTDSCPETYALAVKADGSTVETAHDGLDIFLIDAPDYLAYSMCKFQTPGEVTLSTKLASDNVTTQIVLSPPQPVLSVRCEGKCLGTYVACYTSSGMLVGPCCNGFCAADLCRPWNTGR
ncbi:Uncharacterized protein TCAP_05958 [Tolypocladium capitatum]|uniref:SSCRP protein n=1 Tax=Tolypocladium capitatum TaxID=45235 RepID=A0A2K3Q9C9_9HYPO|nr:Uncharacterized protein TCAP_05958 [Tolypocladium capitatum]